MGIKIKRDKAGRPRKVKDPRASSIVKALAQYGVPQDRICTVLAESGFEKISYATLEREYADELATGKAMGESKLMETAFKLASDGNVTMLIFLLKTRLGLRETNRVEMTSPDGSMTPKSGAVFNLDGLTDEQLDALAQQAFTGTK